MPVRKDDNGQRSVEAEIEVPGSPEEVWHAIATGHGISSWFVPSQVEQREGGTVVNSFGPGMDSVATITQWDPPKSFTAETEEEPGTVATQWTVETRDGGTCVVRVVHRWFASTDDWDAQFEGHAYGWATSFFRMLRLYLTHFPGRPCSAFQLSAVSESSAPETWQAIKSVLNIEGAGQRFQSGSGVPEAAGTVERKEIDDPELLRTREQLLASMDWQENEEPELLLRLDQPAPGLAHLFVVPMGGPTMVSIRFHFFGDQGAAVAHDAERAWNEWLARQFPQEAVQ